MDLNRIKSTVNARIINLDNDYEIASIGISSYGKYNRISKSHKRLNSIVGSNSAAYLDLEDYGLEECILVYGQQIENEDQGLHRLEISDELIIYNTIIFFGKNESYLGNFPQQQEELLHQFLAKYVLEN
ncbi:hypothetical protein [Geomicrobium sp. JCM 19037]|uniref:hypothetical protein n=1 Tax=Geomicrobium sp. JCM 19037 TaxID=1460634 RepID=UPI0005AAF5C0|nr:hypothetical protein [Geomicrobium sp. JCM 19037]